MMTSPSNAVFYTDRSAAELDDKCGMAFWLNRYEGGTGIVPKEEPFYFAIGRETHQDLATLAEMSDISPGAIQEAIDDIIGDLTADDKLVTKRMEILYRRLGWFAGWALFIEPSIRNQYRTVHIEHEICLDRTPLWVGITPDRILRDRVNGHLVYMEYKSTLTAAPKWLESWRYSVQLHSSMAAISEELEEPIRFSQIIGLMKGYESSGADRHLNHPYVWAYYNEGTNQWTHKYDEARTAAWRAMPVWEYPGGIAKWVQACGADTAWSQFPRTSPIFYNKILLDDWVARRSFRMQKIATAEHLCRSSPSVRSKLFERRQAQCRPAYGDQCAYLPLCWNATWRDNPTGHPDFVMREPHHELELLVRKENQDGTTIGPK